MEIISIQCQACRNIDWKGLCSSSYKTMLFSISTLDIIYIIELGKLTSDSICAWMGDSRPISVSISGDSLSDVFKPRPFALFLGQQYHFCSRIDIQ